MELFRENLRRLLDNPERYVSRRDGERNLNAYAIVDSAIERVVIGHFETDEPEYWILYSGTNARDYELVAPYLVKIDMNNEFTQRIFEDGYGKNWVSLVFSYEDGDTLAEHLRNFTSVYDNELEQDVLIRFYDPRAILKYFRSFYEEESENFFSKLDAIMVGKLDEPEKLNYYCLNIKERTVKRGEVDLNKLGKGQEDEGTDSQAQENI